MVNVSLQTTSYFSFDPQFDHEYLGVIVLVRTPEPQEELQAVCFHGQLQVGPQVWVSTVATLQLQLEPVRYLLMVPPQVAEHEPHADQPVQPHETVLHERVSIVEEQEELSAVRVW